MDRFAFSLWEDADLVQCLRAPLVAYLHMSDSLRARHVSPAQFPFYPHPRLVEMNRVWRVHQCFFAAAWTGSTLSATSSLTERTVPSASG